MAADELLATRREKLERLRADGIEPYPHAYPGVVPGHADGFLQIGFGVFFSELLKSCTGNPPER